MSFSTPSMSSDESTTTTAHITMPRINSPFANKNLPQMAPGSNWNMVLQKGFPTSHMPSPWNTGQSMFVNSEQHMAPGGQKQTSWGVSSIPPIDIEVVSNSQQDSKADTKIAWTSAEQLAEALFPSDAEHVERQLEPITAGLLDHKEQIENLHKTSSKLSALVKNQKQIASTHNILISAQEARQKSVFDDISMTQAETDFRIDKHGEALHDHRDHIQDILCSNTETRKDIVNHTSALLNHRDEIRSTQKQMTSRSDTQQAMITSIQNDNIDRRRLLDAHGTCITSMQQDIKEMKSTILSANNNGEAMRTMQQDIKHIKTQLPKESERDSNALVQQRVIDLHTRSQDMQREIKRGVLATAERDRNNVLIQQRVEDMQQEMRRAALATAESANSNALIEQRVSDLHTRAQNMQRSVNKHDTTLDSLVSANNAINDHISSMAARPSSERQVQVQVLGPRSRR
jgi:hypothetical protein